MGPKFFLKTCFNLFIAYLVILSMLVFIRPRYTWGPIYGSGCLKVTLLADLTDVTLADEDTNSILAANDNRAIQGNLAMQVAPPGVQIFNQCK